MDLTKFINLIFLKSKYPPFFFISFFMFSFLFVFSREYDVNEIKGISLHTYAF